MANYIYLGAKLPNRKYEKVKIENCESVVELKLEFSRFVHFAFGGKVLETFIRNFFVLRKFSLFFF
jgi:hypothetical protein